MAAFADVGQNRFRGYGYSVRWIDPTIAGVVRNGVLQAMIGLEKDHRKGSERSPN